MASVERLESAKTLVRSNDRLRWCILVLQGLRSLPAKKRVAFDETGSLVFGAVKALTTAYELRPRVLCIARGRP
jgi:hypothetical protein